MILIFLVLIFVILLFTHNDIQNKFENFTSKLNIKNFDHTKYYQNPMKKLYIPKLKLFKKSKCPKSEEEQGNIMFTSNIAFKPYTITGPQREIRDYQNVDEGCTYLQL